MKRLDFTPISCTLYWGAHVISGNSWDQISTDHLLLILHQKSASTWTTKSTWNKERCHSVLQTYKTLNSQGPRRDSKLMGSRFFGKVENYLIQVPFSVKIWVSIEFPQKLMGSKSFSQNWWVHLNPSNPCWRGPCTYTKMTAFYRTL